LELNEWPVCRAEFAALRLRMLIPGNLHSFVVGGFEITILRGDITSSDGDRLRLGI